MPRKGKGVRQLPGDTDSAWQVTFDLYYPYLIEIRGRLAILGIFFAVFALLGFVFYEKFITFFLSLLHLNGINVVFTSPFQFINLALCTGLALGLIGTLPVAVLQLFSFLKPALNKNEYNAVKVIVPLVFFLFVVGFIYGFLTMRYVLVLFQQQSKDLNIGNFLDVSGLLSNIIITSSVLGLAFQYPLILTALVRLKVIKFKMLVLQRIPAYIIALIFATLLPTTDVLSLVLLTIPLILLYELTIFLNRFVLRAHLED